MAAGSFFLDETRRLRTVWRLLLFFFGFVTVQIIISLDIIVPVIIYFLATGGIASVAPGLRRFAEHRQLLTCITAVPMGAGLFGLVWVWRRFLDRRSLSSLGLVKPEARWSASVWTGLATGMLPIDLAVAVLLALGLFEFGGGGASVFTAAMVPAFLIMAFIEELIFRGYFLQNMLDIGRPISGVLASALVFGIFHGLNPHAWDSPASMANLVLAGVLLALAYMLSGNLWFPTAMHFGWNACQGPLFGIPVSGMPMDGLLRFTRTEPGNRLLTGGEFGLEGSVLMILLQLGLILVFLALLLRRRRAGTPKPPPVPLYAEPSGDQQGVEGLEPASDNRE